LIFGGPDRDRTDDLFHAMNSDIGLLWTAKHCALSPLRPTAQVTHSPGRIGYASGKLPYNRLVSNLAGTLNKWTICRLYVQVTTSAELTESSQQGKA
jgi:hypothetical protein